MQPVIVYFDGLCEAARPGGQRNPGGLACGGYHIPPRFDVPGLEQGLRGGAYFLGGDGATNNVAEYLAAQLACERLAATGYVGRVVLRGDSQLVIRQFTGEWRINTENLRRLRDGLRAQAGRFASFQAEWVPREENSEADAESRRAYEAEKHRRVANPL